MPWLVNKNKTDLIKFEIRELILPVFFYIYAHIQNNKNKTKQIIQNKIKNNRKKNKQKQKAKTKNRKIKQKKTEQSKTK